MMDEPRIPEASQSPEVSQIVLPDFIAQNPIIKKYFDSLSENEKQSFVQKFSSPPTSVVESLNRVIPTVEGLKEDGIPEAEKLVAVAENQVRVGKVLLQINDTKERKTYVPPLQKFVETSQNILEDLAMAISMDDYVLLEGPSGIGKSDSVKYLASITKNNLREVSLNGGVTVDEFIGRRVVTSKGIEFQEGILPEAMRKGHFLLINELNACLPDTLFCLFQLMDSQRRITLIENENEIIVPHKNFRLFATMNPCDRYAGTKELNKALEDRFPVKIVVTYPSNDEEIEIVQGKPGLSKIQKSLLKKMTKFATQTRTAYAQGKLDHAVSTRSLINFSRYYLQHNEPCKPFLNTILYKYDKNCWEMVAKLFEAYFPEWQVYKQTKGIQF